MLAALSSNLVGAGLGTDVPFNRALASNNIAPSATGSIPLTAGKTYQITAVIHANQFANSTSGDIRYQLVDATTNAVITSSNTGIALPVTVNASTPTATPTLECVYKPSVNQSVKVRITSSSAGTAQFYADFSYVLVKQLDACPVTASNGLTASGNNVVLGGALSQATTIAQSGYNLSFTGGNVGIGTTTPNSTLQVNGSLSVKVTAGLAGGGVSNPVVLGDVGYFGLSPAGGSSYYQLPAAATYVGRVYYLRNNNTSQVATLTTTGELLFDGGSSNGVSTYDLGTSGSSKSVTAISDGTNWTILRSGN